MVMLYGSYDSYIIIIGECFDFVNVCSTSSCPNDPLNPFSRKTGVLQRWVQLLYPVLSLVKLLSKNQRNIYIQNIYLIIRRLTMGLCMFPLESGVRSGHPIINHPDLDYHKTSK